MTDEEPTHHEKPTRKRGKRRTRAHGTGSIFRHPERRNKPWVAQILLDNGKTRQRYFRTQEEAATALNEMLYEQKRGMLPSEKDQTVEQHFEHWLEVHKTQIRQSSYLEYQRILKRHILPKLGHLSLQQLTARDIDTFYAQKLEEGLSPTRIAAFHSTIHMALQQAVRWRLLARNVSEDVSPPRETQSRERQVLTPEQAQQLLLAAKGHRLEAMVTVALATGMRRGELLALCWNDIDFSQRCLFIRHSVRLLPGGYRLSDPKTPRSKRTIPLPQFALESLQQHRLRQLEAKLKAGPAWEDHDLVFCNIYGRFLSTRSLFYLFASLLKKAGLPHMRFHDLRHSAATILLAMGVPIKVIQELLGHSDIGTTLNIYGHVLTSMQQEAVEKLENFFGNGAAPGKDSGQS